MATPIKANTKRIVLFIQLDLLIIVSKQNISNIEYQFISYYKNQPIMTSIINNSQY